MADENELMPRVAVVQPSRVDVQQAVRYVLIHDLGLDREGVRADATTFVEETVAKYFASADTERMIVRVVAEEVAKMLRKRGPDFGSLENMVARVAERMIREYIKEHLRFDILDEKQINALVSDDLVVKGRSTFLKPEGVK